MLAAPTTRTLSDQDIKILMDNAHTADFSSRHFLDLDPAIPSLDADIDQSQLQEWINLHTEVALRTLAEKLAKNICHVTFDAFYETLKSCIHRINTLYNQQAILGEEVILAVPFLGANKSNPWVTSLALRHFRFKPIKIIDTVSFEYMQQYLEKNPNIKKILLLDDASYSGVDLDMKLESVIFAIKKAKSHATIDMVIPYITQTALNKFLHNAQVLFHQIMPTIDQLPEFSANEKKLLDSLNISGYHNYYPHISIARLTLYYFDHKLADSYSVPEKILKYGLRLDSAMTNDECKNIAHGVVTKPNDYDKNTRKFIPDIAPCYKELAPAKRLSELPTNNKKKHRFS